MFSIISEIGQRGGSRYFVKHSDIKKILIYQKGGEGCSSLIGNFSQFYQVLVGE